MKDRLLKRYGQSVAVLQSATQLLANDQVDEFSSALDNGLEGISRIQDDLAIYSKLVSLEKRNAELELENSTLKTECEKYRAESE